MKKQVTTESALSLCDGMYYEVTFNGDREEVYLDAYKKFENVCRKLGRE